jgi:hypothetical protein
MRIGQIAAFLALVMLANATSGCSLVGLVIGSAVPKRKTIDPSQAAKGDEVTISLDDDQEITGRVADTVDNALHVQPPGWPPPPPISVPLGRVRAMSVRKGSYWDHGLVLGLVVDLVTVVTVTVLFAKGLARAD